MRQMSRSRSGILGASVIYLFLFIVLVISLFPVCWAALTSTKTNTEIITRPYGLPEKIEWINYALAWDIGHFASYAVNSVIVTVPAVLVTVTVSLLAGFSLAKLKIRGSRFILLFFLLGLMVPFHGYMIPVYLNMRALNLLDNRLGTALVISAVGLPFSIYLMKSALSKVPDELMESAALDGANPARVLLRIVAPLSMPTITALLVIQTISSWNDLIVPLITLQSGVLRTISIGLTFYRTRFSDDYALTAAGAIIAATPLLIVYVAFQRQFVRGILAGAIKS